jgi:hypothetical protein
MCNLYSITTNQAAIIALFRGQPLRRQSAADAGRVSRLSRSGDPQHQQRHRTGYDALGYASATTNGRTAGD